MLTLTHDVGTPSNIVTSYINQNAEWWSHYKLGIGSIHIERQSEIEKKVKICKENEIEPYPGGTAFEYAVINNAINDYQKKLTSLGIKIIEISNGTIDLPLVKRLDYIKLFLDHDFSVIAEVGRKFDTDGMAPYQWVEEINTLDENGCSLVTLEGRSDQTSGIFRPSGELRAGLVSEIFKFCNTSKLVVEASTLTTQCALMALLGSTVNFGNVPIDKVFELHCARNGLKGETLKFRSAVQ